MITSIALSLTTIGEIKPRAALTLTFRKQAGIDDDVAVDPLDAPRRHGRRELADNAERIAVESMAVGAAVRVVDVFERERVAGADST
jgi:hypothetical protein